MGTIDRDNMFDYASAFYHYLQHNWAGQSCPKYAAFCQLTAEDMYKPSRSAEYFDNIEECALMIYNELNESNWEATFNDFMAFLKADNEDD